MTIKNKRKKMYQWKNATLKMEGTIKLREVFYFLFSALILGKRKVIMNVKIQHNGGKNFQSFLQNHPTISLK